MSWIGSSLGKTSFVDGNRTPPCGMFAQLMAEDGPVRQTGCCVVRLSAAQVFAAFLQNMPKNHE